MKTGIAVLAAVTVVAGGCGGGRAAEAPRAKPVEFLPDLVASPPSTVMTGTLYAGGHYHSYLGFDTRVTNLGTGVLDIVGRRRRGDPVMVADQLVHQSVGAPIVIRGIAWLRYAGQGHDHWHLLPFADYELIGADGARVHVRGRKQGFCIAGISVGVGRPTRKMPSVCGEGKPRATGVHERLAVRNADQYGRFAEGQSIRLNGVPAGRYYLVLRLNATRRIRESDYANDVATALVRIGYRGGPATVRTLQRCRWPPPCLPSGVG